MFYYKECCHIRKVCPTKKKNDGASNPDVSYVRQGLLHLKKK
jgi:hypothetical protein